MDLSSRILGTTIARELGERASAAVLIIGRDTFTRGQLSSVACFNFMAAQRLTAAVEALDVATTRDLYDRIPPATLAGPGVGAISLAVLGAAFEAKGIGGDAPLESWFRKHRPSPNGDPLATFTTVKHRAAAEASDDRRDRAARTHARRDAAHRARVDRFSRRRQRTT